MLNSSPFLPKVALQESGLLRSRTDEDGGKKGQSLITSGQQFQGQMMAEVEQGQGLTTPCQQLPDPMDEGDDDDGGVNLVVKSTYWWCKDCNVKQKFGCGESMEDHLRQKHNIGDRSVEQHQEYNQHQEYDESIGNNANSKFLMLESEFSQQTGLAPATFIHDSVCAVPSAVDSKGTQETFYLDSTVPSTSATQTGACEHDHLYAGSVLEISAAVPYVANSNLYPQIHLESHAYDSSGISADPAVGRLQDEESMAPSSTVKHSLSPSTQLFTASEAAAESIDSAWSEEDDCLDDEIKIIPVIMALPPNPHNPGLVAPEHQPVSCTPSQNLLAGVEDRVQVMCKRSSASVSRYAPARLAKRRKHGVEDRVQVTCKRSSASVSHYVSRAPARLAKRRKHGVDNTAKMSTSTGEHGAMQKCSVRLRKLSPRTMDSLKKKDALAVAHTEENSGSDSGGQFKIDVHGLCSTRSVCSPNLKRRRGKDNGVAHESTSHKHSTTSKEHVHKKSRLSTPAKKQEVARSLDLDSPRTSSSKRTIQRPLRFQDTEIGMDVTRKNAVSESKKTSAKNSESENTDFKSLHKVNVHQTPRKESNTFVPILEQKHKTPDSKGMNIISNLESKKTSARNSESESADFKLQANVPQTQRKESSAFVPNVVQARKTPKRMNISNPKQLQTGTSQTSDASEIQTSMAQISSQSATLQSSSGRTIKKPGRYSDYPCSIKIEKDVESGSGAGITDGPVDFEEDFDNDNDPSYEAASPHGKVDAEFQQRKSPSKSKASVFASKRTAMKELDKTVNKGRGELAAVRHADVYAENISVLKEADEIADFLPEYAGQTTKGLHSCKDCGRKFLQQFKLRKHEERYQGGPLQECTVCNMKMHNTDLLNVHFYYVHQTRIPTRCMTCNITCGSKKKLLHHLLTHPNGVGQSVTNLVQDSCKTHKCTVCHQPVVIGEGRVEKHYATHQRLESHSCPICKKTFFRKAELYSHLIEHGTGPSVDANQQQGTQNSSGVSKMPTSATIKHETKGSKQRKQGPYVCSVCGEEFALQGLLKLHSKNHVKLSSVSLVGQNKEVEAIDLSHGVPSNIPCTLLKVEGTKLLQFQDDMRKLEIALGRNPPTNDSKVMCACTLCDKTLDSGKKLLSHMHRFRDESSLLQCHKCSGKFHNLDTFNVHYAFTHSFESPAVCFTCMKEFSNKSDFFTHLGNSPTAHPQSLKLGQKTFFQDACGKVGCSICRRLMWNYPVNIAKHTRQHGANPFPCPVCDMSFRYKYAWLIHLQFHTNSKNVDLIRELSQRELEQSDLAEQVDKIHAVIVDMERPDFEELAVKAFACPVCELEIFQQRKNIHSHLDGHARKLLSTIRDKRYFCPDCGEDLPVEDPSIVVDHLTSHGQSEPSFICLFCREKFTVYEDYSNHFNHSHWLNKTLDKLYVCEVCGVEMTSRKHLQRHVKLHKEKQGHFKCSRCTQTFRFESKLKSHMAKHDSGNDSLACQFCGKLYMTKISLNRHEQVEHLGIKDFRFKCRYCEAQFIGSTLRRNHENAIHKNKDSYFCEVCKKGFRYQSTHDRHKRTAHAGDTPYICQECGAKFPTQKLLLQHSACHTGFNPLACPECHKVLASARAVRDHLNFFHRNIFNYNCDSCGKRFPRQSNLNRHIKERCRGVAVETRLIKQKVEEVETVSLIELTDLTPVEDRQGLTTVYTLTGVAGGVPVIQATSIQ